MKVALDTTYILGRGAVKDTYNLLSDSRADRQEWLTWNNGHPAFPVGVQI